MKKELAVSDPHQVSNQAKSDHAGFQIQVLPLQNMSSNLSWDKYDGEPVIWFGPVIFAALAMMILLGGVIIGVVAISRRFMMF
jgi:hypothetical protein